MRPILQELVDLLALDRLEVTSFRGRSQDLGWGTVFGGQVLGQALSAAAQTVPEDRGVHSLHGYFLRPGDVTRPIDYDVDTIRDGRSFTTRRVLARQGGHAIFTLEASFQVVESGFEHQDPMPEVPGPDGLPSEVELAKQIAHRIPSPLRERATSERPIESRPVSPQDPVHPVARPAVRCVWYRTIDPLPDAPRLHAYLLAYASDFHFLTTAMQPHGVSWLTPGMQVSSLDHAIWFHRPFRMDDWLVHVIESPSASGARGLVRGRFYARDGALVATTVQEGLMRRRDALLR